MIFKESMNTKTKAIGIFILCFTIFSIIYYEIVINYVAEIKDEFHELGELRSKLSTSSDQGVILELTGQSDKLFEEIRDASEILFNAFQVIEILSFFNITFLLQTMVTLLYTNRLKRQFHFPGIIHFTDTVLFICSCLLIQWI